MKSSDSIRNRLRRTYALLALLPLIIVGLILTGLSFVVQNDQALVLQQELAKRVGSQVSSFIENLEDELKVAGESADIVALSTTEQNNLLSRLRSEQSAFVDLFLIDGNGNERVYQSYLNINTAVSGISWLETEAFIRPAATQETYFSPVTFEDSNEPQMTISIPLVDSRSGETEAILLANVRFKEIWDLIASIDVSPGESVYILDADGTLVAHRNPSLVFSNITFSVPETNGISSGLETEQAVIATEPLIFGEQELIIVAEKSVSQALALAINTVWIILAVTVASLLLAYMVSIMASRQIIDPIQQLATLAASIRQGDLKQRAERGGLVELDDLALTFNQMSGQLQETLQGLEQRVDERTQALKNSAEVSRYLSTILEQEQLLSQVIERLQTDFGFIDSNVYLVTENNQLELVTENRKNTPDKDASQLYAQEEAVGQAVLSDNECKQVSLEDERVIATHLSMPIRKGNDCIGVLNVYKPDRDSIGLQDVDLVESIANQLGIALKNAQSFEQLLEEKFEEARKTEEAERQLEAYRNSPLGKAEQVALELLNGQDQSLLMMYDFVQNVGQNPQDKPVLENLPQAIANLSESMDSDRNLPIRSLQNIADGFEFLMSGQEKSELISIGLREITANLANSESAGWEGVDAIRAVYGWCFEALQIESIEGLANLSFEVLTPNHSHFMIEISQSLLLLHSVQKTCYTYLRVQEAGDKIAYLVTAVEQLRKVDRTLRTNLGEPERAVLERIIEQWLTVTTTAMSSLQTQAKLSYKLITKHTWQNDVVGLTFSVHNGGRGAALNIRIQIAESQNYRILDKEQKISQLSPGEETQVIIRLRPTLQQDNTQFRVLFQIQFADSRGTDQYDNFADVVFLMKAEGEFQYIPNPYVVGTPLDAESELFFGRQKLFGGIKEDLTSNRKHNLVLIGQRRMGKTSLLKQLQTRYDDEMITVYLDGQSLALDPGMAGFFLNVATEISFALEDHGLDFEPPDLFEFEKRPAVQFERHFLTAVFDKINDRHLLILFDEFEELENAVKRGHLEQTVFGFLRHLMQHYKNLSFIFCGTHRLEELAADYWSVLFNISLYHQVNSLTEEESYQLIQEPIAQYGLRYDDLSLEKIWRVTSGHPYFLQLLCHSLVNRHNRLEKRYMTIADVNAALEEILSAGEAHFIYLWTESSSEEKLALFSISRTMPLTGRISPIQVSDFWQERGKSVDVQAFRHALHQLQLREILIGEDVHEIEGDHFYRWKLGLLGMWVEKYKSSSRVWDEVQS